MLADVSAIIGLLDIVVLARSTGCRRWSSRVPDRPIRDYFRHLTVEKFLRKVLAGEIDLPVVRMEFSCDPRLAGGGESKTADNLPAAN